MTAGRPGPASIVPRPAGEPAPLSLAQQRLWFLDRLEPGSAVYNIPAALRLAGRLDREGLRRSLETILDRHEALRAGFASAQGRPVQTFAPAGTRLDLPGIDLSRLPGDRREAALRGLLAALAAWPFDLSRPPLLRTHLIELGGEERVLFLNLHHIVADGWSLTILVRELAALYTAFATGEVPELPPLPVQYADFARWQRDPERGEALGRQLAWWRERLAGMPAALDFPADRPRPAVQSFRGARVRFSLPEPLRGRLGSLAERAQATPFMVLLAAFQVLLCRWSGQEDFGVATFVAGRGRPEVEGLIGFFVNTLVLRADLAGDPSFQRLLEKVRRGTLAAFDHQDLPFDRLVEGLQVERDPARPPLAQVGFVLQNLPAARLELPGLERSPVDVERDTAKLDLALVLSEAPDGGLAGSLEYDTALFDAPTARRLAEGYRTLLEALAAGGQRRRISELPVSSEAERHALAIEWNDSGRAPGPAACLHELFEAQAARTPAATAVVRGHERWSYADLDARAEALARRLRACGIGPEARVAVCLPRTPDLVAALLAVLKAGGAYVPIDPAWPRERSSCLRADSRAGLLINESWLAEGPGNDEADDGSADETADSLGAGPANLAYLIYTSGSTGQPKGVAVEHRSATALLGCVAAAAGQAGLAGVLAAGSVGFDVSVLEIFAPLAAGGAVILAENALELPELPAAEEVTLAAIVPSTLAALLRRGRLPPGVRTVLAGGEPLSRALAERILREPGLESLWNCYGPTETTVYSLAGRVAPGEEPSLGRPIPGTRAYLLERALERVPLGARGVLHLEGDGLARGYDGRPDLTAERFLPDPFAERPGERLYATGDLARQRADGRFDFLGRADQQVKVRGLRVEPGEVEAALRLHPGVREAAVVALREGGETRLAGFFVAAADLPAAELRRHLRERLPEALVPADLVPLPALPATPGGKLDRAALLAAARPAGGPAETGGLPPRTGLERTVAAVWREVLGVERVGLGDNFFDLGGHSLRLVEVHDRLRAALPGVELSVLDLFRHPTVGALAAHLSGRGGGQEAGPAPERSVREAGGPWDIAVVGMAVRFPGAPDVDAFWRNLRDGVESVRRFSAEELRAAGVDAALVADPAYVPARGVLDGVELFDPGFFGLSPREASLMDPQHRIFLECAWEALEAAGCDPARFPGRIGVFAGVGVSTYLWSNLASHPGLLASGGLQTLLGNDKDFLATRASYLLNLRGPSVGVQSACSTSLVAVHLACRGLLDGDCEAALAGGVTIRVPQAAGYLYQEGGILSPDGRCRVFDEAAQGTVGGNGAGLVLLKRLEDARAAGDTVYAVIKGAAINNDGADKVGYTAPSVSGQAAAVAEALARAGVAPETVGYVEAHGTGTPLGDPIEVAALVQALGDRQGRPRAIGSVKTNFGHLDTAAGVAGLIKTVLALRHRQIPPSLGFERPSGRIDFGSLRVATRLADWEADGAPRRAGVSSFGIGGTNAHVVLEEAPAPEPAPPGPPGVLLPLAARTPAALEAMAAALASHLEGHPDPDLANAADIAFTLQTGRRAFAHRRFVIAAGRKDAVAALRDPSRAAGAEAPESPPPVVFLFPGQGNAYAGMGRQLYETEPVFRSEVDRCAEILASHLGLDLRGVLYPADSDRAIAETRLAQPALFVTEYALARLWESWGVRPSAMAGHSLGEYVAAWLAGVFSLEDALGLVAARGALMQELPPGAMLAVPLPEAEVAGLLRPGLDLATVNGPRSCVVAGPEEGVEALRADLAARGIDAARLRTSHAFHSAMMDPVLDAFGERVARLSLRPPALPYLSNLTGTWITAEEATDPSYWVCHLRHTVRLGLAELDPDAVSVEVGPGRSLANLLRQGEPGRTVLPSLRHPTDPRPDRPFLLHTLGRLWLAGVEIDWNAVSGPGRRRVALPTYPFERQRCWVEPGAGPSAALLARRSDPGDWLFAPVWKRTPPLQSWGGGSSPLPQPASSQGGGTLPPGTTSPDERPWLLFLDGSGLGRALADELLRAGLRVVPVELGELRGPQDYVRLLDGLDTLPGNVLHLWSLAAPSGDLRESTDLGFYSLLHLAQALVKRGLTAPVRILAVGSGLHDVTGEEPLRPESATLLGPCLVIPQEHPEVHCRALDVVLPGNAAAEEKLAGRILAEAVSGATDPVVALRGGHRWVRELAPVPADKPDPGALRLRRGGTYLITGGLGRIGLTVAAFLAEAAGARLALLGRSAVAPARITEIERLGGEVLPLQADVADSASLAAAVAAARARFGRIDGVFHAAGLLGEGTWVSVAAAGRESCDPQFRPKALGVLALEEAFAAEPPDFFLLFSSISALLGGLGFAAYAAANLYLDAFAQSRSREGGPAWVSVGWDAWRFGERQRGGPGSQLGELALTPEEGTEVLRRLFSNVAAAPHLVVSTADPRARLARWVERPEPGPAPTAIAAPVSVHARPALATPYVAPRDPEEERIAALWGEMLGIEGIGVHDDFFELGGHSVMVTQIAARLRQSFQAEVRLERFFAQPTVAGLAEAVRESEAAAKARRLEEILLEIERLEA